MEFLELRKPQKSYSLVFVHGIMSDGKGCWKNKNGTYWPELLMEEADFKDFGIYVFTYQTSVFSGTYSINDIVDHLKEDVFKINDLITNKQLVFVCHSMGGIIARKLIVERSQDFIQGNTQIGLFLVASPSLGSKLANVVFLAAWLVRNSQAKVLRFYDDNIWLNGLDKEFINLKESGRLRIYGKELIEDKPIILNTLLLKVVTPISGAKYFGNSVKVPKSNHFSISKPDGKDAFQHHLLCSFLREFVANLLTKYSISIPKSWQFKNAAQAIVKSDDCFVIFEGFSESELSLCLLERQYKYNSISEGLSNLKLLNNTIPKYEVNGKENVYTIKKITNE